MTIEATDITMKAISGGLLTQPDSTPDPFESLIVDATNAPINQAIISNEFTPTGVDSFASSIITVDVGSYSLNGNPFTSVAGIWNAGDGVRLQNTSSGMIVTAVNQICTIGGVSGTFTITTSGGSMAFTEIFNDPIEDANFASRGWYDGTTKTLSNDGAFPGSTQSIEFKWLLGSLTPVNGGAMRLQFTATDNIYLSYYVKYLSTWQGSGVNFHPHEFHFLTNLASNFSGLSDTNMTAYVHQTALKMRLSIQDSQNIDEDNIGEDLRLTTENRSVAGCNSGAPPGPVIGDCFGIEFDHKNEFLVDGAGLISVDVWHKVEAFFKMNTISGSIGQTDGIFRCWLDGVLEIEKTDLILRTNQNATMEWNQFIIAPFIGVGSPIEQTFLIDDITLGVE